MAASIGFDWDDKVIYIFFQWEEKCGEGPESVFRDVCRCHHYTCISLDVHIKSKPTGKFFRSVVDFL